MKRFAVLLTLFALLAVPLIADARRPLRRQEVIRFQHRAILNPGPLGIADTSFVTHTGAITDTTESFSQISDQTAFAPYVLGADSLNSFDLIITVESVSTITAATDSIYITRQGSFNGKTWISGPQVSLAEQGNGSGLSFFKGYATTRLGSITIAAPTDLQMGAFPLHRFIVVTSAGTVGRIVFTRAWLKDEN